MPDSQPRVVDFLQGKPVDRPPIVPLVGRLAASVAGIPTEIFLSNATQLTTSLGKAHRLFGYDGVLNCFDPTAVSEALGASLEWDPDHDRFTTVNPVTDPEAIPEPKDAPERGRLPLFVDAVERLASENDEAAVFGVLPGPFLTVRHLTGGDVSADRGLLDMVSLALNELARAYGHADVDVLLLIERAEAASAIGWGAEEAIQEELEIAETLSNIAGFYGAPLTFAPHGFDTDSLQPIETSSALDGLFIGQSEIPHYINKNDIPVGIGIPSTTGGQSSDELANDVTSSLSSASANAFVASGWEIHPDTHPDQIHAAMSSAKQWAENQS